MWKLRIEDDQSNRTVVNLVRKEYTIGRAEHNEVRLTERNVSRSHAKLERAGEAWLLTDLNSYTGTFVDDERVEGHVTIGHDTRLRIGDYSLLLFDDAQQSVAAADRDAMTVPAPLPSSPPKRLSDRLVVLVGPNRGAEYPLGERRLLIGRGEECDIALNDTSVSRVHADVERDESGRFRIGDLGSSNGLRVNGMEVQDTTLYSGDVVELGDVELQFVPAGQVFTPSDHPKGAKRSGWRQLSSAQRWAVGAVGVAGAVTLGVLWLSPAQNVGMGSKSSEATQALHRAEELLDQGQITAAHESLEVIRKESNLRSSPAFARVEAAWADALLEEAQTTDDLDVKRKLLDAVAKAETVDGLRRRRAANQLEELNARNLEPTDLPQAMADEEEDAGQGPRPTVDEVQVETFDVEDEPRRVVRPPTAPRVPPSSPPTRTVRPAPRRPPAAVPPSTVTQREAREVGAAPEPREQEPQAEPMSPTPQPTSPAQLQPSTPPPQPGLPDSPEAKGP